MAATPPEYKHSPKCQKCSSPFNFINRKHHCRNCGNTFCGKCSMKSAPIPSYGFVEPVRVCDKCYDDLRATQGFVDVPTRSEREAAETPSPTATAATPATTAATPASSSEREPARSAEADEEEPAPEVKSEAAAPAAAPVRKRVKDCKCNMPLCICPADPETEEEKEEKKKAAAEKKVPEKKKPEKPAATSTSTSTSTASKPTAYAPGFQSSFLGFGQKQTREYDLKGDLNNQCREAVKAQDLEGVKLLLKSGAKADYKDRTGNTLLHLAAMFDNTELVKILILSGADPYVKNPDKESPIDIAPPALALKMKQLVPAPTSTTTATATSH